MLNRLPGGIGDSVRAVERLLGDQNEATVLDVGTGSGDFVAALAPTQARRGDRFGRPARDPGDRGS